MKEKEKDKLKIKIPSNEKQMNQSISTKSTEIVSTMELKSNNSNINSYNNYITNTEYSSDSFQIENNGKEEKKKEKSKKKIKKNFLQKIISYKKLKKGNLTLYYFNHKKIPQIIIGPDYKSFIFGFSFFVIYYIVIFTLTFKLTNFFFELIGLFFSIIQLLFYILSFLLNPGIQLKKPKEDDEYIPTCIYCGVIKKLNIKQKHCFSCNICILGYDHHCVWIGKCVGKGNKIYFRLFLFFCLFNFFYMIILISLTYQINPN